MSTGGEEVFEASRSLFFKQVIYRRFLPRINTLPSSLHHLLFIHFSSSLSLYSHLHESNNINMFHPKTFLFSSSTLSCFTDPAILQIRVRRIYDKENNNLVYASFSTRLDKGDDSNKSRFKSSICAVHVNNLE